MNQTILALQDGTKFQGNSPAWQKDTYHGEVVFTTGMTGYVETLTDPSYAGQIIVFTYPLIGNYGVPPKKYWESRKIFARGVVISENCDKWSHGDGRQSLLQWLKEQSVPIITGVDTRELTKLLREHGVMLGKISRNTHHVTSNDFEDLNKSNLVSDVSIKRKRTYGKGRKKIIAVDCGTKENIIRSLQKYDLTIKRVPYDYDYTKEKFDGVFISNGPGDPMMACDTVEILKKAMKQKKPIFGICLGSQIMGLAAGAKTYKLPYGHRGQNQPCIDEKTRRCYITSQNHGYAVRENTIPRGWKINFRNLNDGSVEGLAHKILPFFSVQFHPEAAPGPTDTEFLFDQFVNLL